MREAMESLTLEEIALHRIFDLKNEVLQQFESHRRLFDEALVCNLFLKNLDPPCWLSSVNNVQGRSKQERYSELYRGFFRKNSISSSVGRSACRSEIPSKKPRFPTCGFVEEKEAGDVAEAEENPRKSRAEGEKGDLADAAPVERNDETLCSEKEKKGECAGGGGKLAQKKPKQGVVKEKDEEEEIVGPPIVGRVTRSRARQCQILARANEETGKRKAAELSGPKQPQIGRNTRARHRVAAKPSSPPVIQLEVEDCAGIRVGGEIRELEGMPNPLRADCRRSSGGDSNDAQAVETSGMAEKITGGGVPTSSIDCRASGSGDRPKEASEMVEGRGAETNCPTDFGETEEKCSTEFESTVPVEEEDSRNIGKCMQERVPSCEIQATVTMVPVDLSSADQQTCTPKEAVLLECHQSSSGKARSSSNRQAGASTIAVGSGSGGEVTGSPGQAMLPDCHELASGKAGLSGKNRAGMTAVPIDSGSQGKAVCMTQKAMAAKCHGSSAAKAGLSGEVLKLTPPPLQTMCSASEALDSDKGTGKPYSDKVMLGLEVQSKDEGEGTEVHEMSHEKTATSPDPMANRVEVNTVLQVEGDDGFGLSCHELNKDHGCITLDSTDNVVKKSLDFVFCKNEVGMAMPGKGEQSCKKQTPFSKYISSSVFSKSLISQGSVGQKHGFGEVISPNFCGGVRGQSDGVLILKTQGPTVKNIRSIRSISLGACVCQDILHGSCTPVALHQIDSSQQAVSSKSLHDSHSPCEGSELPRNTEQGERNLSCEAAVHGSESQSKTMEFRPHICRTLGHESCPQEGLSSEKKQGHAICSDKISLLEDMRGKETASAKGDKLPVHEASLENISDHDKGQCLEDSLGIERERSTYSVEVTPEECQVSPKQGLASMIEKANKVSVSTPMLKLSHSKVGKNDPVLAICHQDRVFEVQDAVLCSVPRGHSSVDSNIDLLCGSQLNRAGLFSQNMFCINEEGLMKQQAISWPNHQERRRQLQQEFCSSSQSRLCQSDDASLNIVGRVTRSRAKQCQILASANEETGKKNASLNIVGYDTSVRLSDHKITPISNCNGLLSKFDCVVTPYTFGSKTYDEGQTCEQRNDRMLVIPLQQDHSSPCLRSSLGTCPDQLHVCESASQIKDDQEHSHSDNEFRQRARLLLEEQLKSKECCSSIHSQFHQGQSDLVASIERKHGMGNHNVLRSSPSHRPSSNTMEGDFCSTSLPQFPADGMHLGVPSISISADCLQDDAPLCGSTVETHSFRTSFEVVSPQRGNTESVCKILHPDNPVSEFSFRKGSSELENGEVKSTPVLKRTVDGELASFGVTNVLRDNKSSSQFTLAEQKPGQDFAAVISEVLPLRKKAPSLEAVCQLQVNFSMDELAKANADTAFESKHEMGPGGSRLTLQSSQRCCNFSSTNQSVDVIEHSQIIQDTEHETFHYKETLQETEGYDHAAPSGDGKLGSKKGNKLMWGDIEYRETQCEHGNPSSFARNVRNLQISNACSSLTPAPDHTMKLRKVTPLSLHWSPAIELRELPEYSGEEWGKFYAFQDSCTAVRSTDKVTTCTPSDLPCFPAAGLHEIPESSGEYAGKVYAFNDSYPAASRSSADKFASNVDFNGGMGFRLKANKSVSLTPVGLKFLDRISTNSMDTDSNYFSKQVPMNIDRVPCFRIEEEIATEEENGDASATVDVLENRLDSSRKKRILRDHNALVDSSIANQNSPMMTPAKGKLFDRISSNSMDIGPNQKQAKSFHLEGTEKENRDACVPRNKFQQRYGSSTKKAVLRSHDARADSSIVRQISPGRSSHKSNNILSDVKSFIPLVQQKQTTAAILTGKRDIKVKALETAETAKRLEEKREQTRKMRKELARREHEKILYEKPIHDQLKGEKEAEEAGRATSDCSNKSISSGVVRKKPLGSTLTKSHLEQVDASTCGVDFKLKRALEAKTKLEQEKLRKLEEEQRRKEEERKKKEAELAAKKRKREEMEKKEREEKRKRLEEAQRQQKELEEQMRAEKEEKEQRRKVVDGFERKRKAMEEEAKKLRRIEKEKEAAERRRRMEGTRSAKLAPKDAKPLEDAHQHQVGQVSSMCNNLADIQPDMEGQSMPTIEGRLFQSEKPDYEIQSYEISPYKGSDDEDENNEDVAPGKFIPLWARKENLIPHLTSQQHIDPDEIFTGAKTCSLNEVFGTSGSYRRRDFNRRSQSGEWLNDSFTWKEEYQYKLKMGYIKHG